MHESKPADGKIRAAGEIMETPLTQLQYESDSWKRLLAFIKEENIHLKTRLAAIASQNFDKSKLKDTEVFQSKSLKTDDWVMLLRHEIADFDKLLAREIFEDGAIKDQVMGAYAKLRNQVSIAEQEFDALVSQFNNYFSTDPSR